MEIVYYEKLESTQKYLIEEVFENNLKQPILIYTNNQTDGIGSRDSKWVGINGNLFFSFVTTIKDLPKDLPLSSISIYFGYLIKDILFNMGSKAYLKWPNDLYLDDKKIGGLISNKKKDFIFVGVGINLVAKDFYGLDINLDIENFFSILRDKILNPISWDRIFKFYKIEFYKTNLKHTIKLKMKPVLLNDAILNQDGSITINNKKVYSLR